jgi:protein-tyrosine phosphatase
MTHVGRVLLVCTGNQCRSPAAEMLLRAQLDGDAYEVWSAGTQARDGAPLHPLTAQALTGHVVRVRRHRARRLTEPDLQGADLVLCAGRSHRVAVAQLHPQVARRTFTIDEFARLVPHLAVAPGPEGLRAVVEQAASMRGADERLDPSSDDLPDPIRGDAAVHEQVVRRLVGSTARVAHLLRHVAAAPG